MTRRRSSGLAWRLMTPAPSSRSTRPVTAPVVRPVASASWPAVSGPRLSRRREHGEVAAVPAEPLGQHLPEEVGRLTERAEGEEGAVVWRGS